MSIETSQEAESTVGPCTALVITHAHGVNTSIHDSRRAAEAALLEYVTQWWPMEAGTDVPMPKDPTEAIDAYFLEHAPYEDYDISVQTFERTTSI